MKKKPMKIVVKAIIFNNEQQVLILRKSKEERSRKDSHGYDFPGGGLEPGEEVFVGLEREIQEETRLQVQPLAPAYIYDEIKEEKHLLILKFTCTHLNGSVFLSDEHESYWWVSLADLPEGPYPQWMKDEIIHAYQILQAVST